jgi:predicted DNA-binding protein YlxM (UPF0122 family)
MDTLNHTNTDSHPVEATVNPLYEVNQIKEQLAQLEERENQLKHYLNGSQMSVSDISNRANDSLNDFQESVNLASEYCQKYPELVPFQEAIINEAMLALIESHVGPDEQIDDRQALELGIKRFQEKLAGYLQKQHTQSQQQLYRNKLLKLDTGLSSPSTHIKSVTQTLKDIGDNDNSFAQFRQHFLQAKGII